MFQITSLKDPNAERLGRRIGGVVLKFGHIIELLTILVVWILIFSQNEMFGGFTRQEIITYLIGGSIISLITGYLLQRLITEDVESEKSYLLVYRPVRYFAHILTHGWAKAVLPFAVAVFLNFVILYFFFNSLILNYDIINIFIIGIMVVLTFILEFMIAYLLKLYVFWTIESPDLYQILMRLKKLLAGNYFPLSFLPVIVVKASLLLPFAYSFFVPAELYLGKISQTTAIRGIGIQIGWIVVLYIIIRLAWKKQVLKAKTAIK